MRIVQLCLLVLSFSFLSRGADRIPRSWHLKLDSDQVAAIERQFKDPKFQSLRLPPGLYAEDLRQVSYRAELSPGNLISQIDFDLPHISGVSHLGLAPYKEGDTQDLWLVLPNNQRFRVASYHPQTQKWISTVLVPTPASEARWFPVGGGVVYFDASWRMFFQPYSEAARKHPEATAEGIPVYLEESSPKRQASAKSLGTGAQVYPAAFFNVNTNATLVLMPETNDGSKVSAVLLPIDTLKAVRLSEAKAWPVSVSNNGIQYVNDGAVMAQDIDWTSGKLLEPRIVRKLEAGETCESVGSLFFILKPDANGTKKTRYTLDGDGKLLPYSPQLNSFAANGTEQDEAMISFSLSMGAGKKIDLLDEINSGAKVPAYSDNTVVTQVARHLGESRNTWVILVYRDGQLPNDLFADFVWKLSTESINVTRSLTPIDRVYQIPGKLFDVPTTEELDELMITLSSATRGRRTITYLPDFPAARQFEVAGATNRLTQFWNHFREGISLGESRIVTSMRQEVFDDIQKNQPGMLRDAKVVTVPDMPQKDIREFILATKTRLERSRGKRFSPEAFELFSNFLTKSNGIGDEVSPGKEVSALTELFDYLETNGTRSTNIDRKTILEWMDSRSGQDVVRRNLDPDKACRTLRNMVVSHDEVIDDLCNAFLAIKQGQRLHERGPLAKFILIGSTGTGKTFLAESFANLLTGKDSLILVNMSEFNRITPASPIYRQIKSAQSQVRVVLFDDVDQVSNNQDAVERLADLMDIGVYGKGTENELDFSNTVVFWTANWAEKLLTQNNINDGSLHEKLGALLTESTTDNPNPPLRPRVWARIETSIYPLLPFNEPQMLELGVVLARAKIQKFKSEQFKDVKIDPQLLMEVAAQEREAKAGARAVVNRLDKQVFKRPEFVKALLNKEVTQILVSQQGDGTGGIVVETNQESGFDLAWGNEDIPDISGWTEKEDQIFVSKYLREFGETVGVPVNQTEHYLKTYPREGK